MNVSTRWRVPITTALACCLVAAVSGQATYSPSTSSMPSDNGSALVPTVQPVDTPQPTNFTLPPVPSPIPAVPSDPPTPMPQDTPAPTEEPTSEAPVSEEPTPSPIAPLITPSPTKAPVTSTPSSAPSTAKPTSASPVTVAPTTLPPSRSPTKQPTDAPVTNAPVTDMPTGAPQEFPTTSRPTNKPVTKSPSASPTTVPSASVFTLSPTTLSPTVNAKSQTPTTKLLGPTSVTNLKVTLTGIDKVPDATQWARATARYFQDFYNGDSDDFLSVQANVYDAVVKVDLVSENSTGVGRKLLSFLRGRSLQTAAVEVAYTQTTIYRTKDSDIDIYDIVEAPLMTSDSRDQYVATLKDMDGYESLTEASAITMPDDGGDKVVDGGGDSGGLSIGAIIGIACGGAALIVLIGGFIYMRSGGDKDSFSDDDRVASTQSATGTSAEPQTSASSMPTYGDQSVATVDYDYSKAYGGAGNYSLSDAGGTLGSRTRQTAADPALLPGSGGTIFSDDQTFDQAYEGVREELLDVYAPAGKLGVVIDTPNDGPPIVHAVKDTSPIADKVQVGDKLVAVDDEDVRDMTAIKVSKLISRKSTNASRKLTIIRSVADR
mmetsp:Transcript_15927/g.34454  ORF Transcript_15927/g.34454 Transcript_15927/m.34454 type:complete len:603 (+) Transcript_15927:294-2102(+)